MEKLGDVRRMIRVREVKLREGRERERLALGARDNSSVWGGWSEVNFVDVTLTDAAALDST